MTIRRMLEWFCTRCKKTFETDTPDPDCPHCDSRWVISSFT